MFIFIKIIGKNWNEVFFFSFFNNSFMWGFENFLFIKIIKVFVFNKRVINLI